MNFEFQFRRYRLALRTAVRTAHGVMTEREGVIVRLTEPASGRTGLGEAATLPEFGTETADEAAAACAELGAKVDAERLASVPRELGCLRNAIAAARADVKQEAGMRPAEGSERRAGDNANYLGIAALLPAGRAALVEAEAKAEAGFRVFKWKVGVAEAGDELVVLDELCERLPEGAKLRLDANGAWDRRTAERWLERCAERPVEFVEQPCFAGVKESAERRRRAEDLLRGLAEDWPVKIALDEALARDGDVERWIAEGWRGIFVVKPSLLGDVGAAVAALRKARSDVVFSSALETAVGARAALRAALAWDGETRRAAGFGVWPLFADARCDGPRAAAFVRVEDVARLDAEAVWNALN